MTRYNSFFPKTEIVFGPGLLERLQDFRGQRIGIVTDTFMASSGALERVRSYLDGCEVEVFAEAVPESPLDTVSAGARQFGAFAPDVLIGLGGGSPIDAAKAMLAILREMAPERRIRLVAIPTTSGTGSEVTAFAVVSDPAKGRKFPLISSELVSDIALLDPELVRSALAGVTADTGMDVITHAVEAVVSTGATHFSDACAEKALELAFAFLPRAFDDGDDMEARDAMHQGSCLAGLAFTAAGLGINHGMAHALGAQMHMVHGRSNALLLPYLIAWNAELPATARRYARIARNLGLDVPSTRAGVRALIREIEKLNAHLGMPATLQAAGCDLTELSRRRPEIAAAAMADACTASNPRKPRQDELEDLLAQIAGHA
ncbi:1-propanol dehydrogenase PduQ [Tropicimonas sp. TH_r6]|uniref:1-propanol dehydrogenase PduQ n=1 Tax=Tropicimonas sp. TH_r6 TaxID=3082085 RepID=UPI00295379B3|nr:1-propanol dehydrogenase PduQ [Tropicimonas sp. TH_r6]MDV7143973.1 1-propanol dehydrogenase PduQ [Tropicimonas sp. TH_r6]